MRTLLLATYLAVLLLPVGGIGFLRLYESALIRQTEAELLAQAAVLSAAYRAAWLERASPEALAAMPTAKLDWGVAPAPASPERWRALLPQLDLADSPILPRRARCRCRPAGPPIRSRSPSAKTLAPVLANVREMTLAGIRIVDAHGIVVASTANAELGLAMVRQEEVAEALRGRAGGDAAPSARRSAATVSWESISRTTALRVFVAVPVVADGRVLGAVLVSRTPRNIVQTLYSKRYALLALAVVLVAVGGGAGLVRGLHRGAADAPARRDGAAGGGGRRARGRAAGGADDARGPVAVRIPSSCWRARWRCAPTMCASWRSASAMSSRRRSPASAAAPSCLRDHLEEMSAEERARFLSNILADTARLERLVRRILELARADALMPSGDEACDVAAGGASDGGRQGTRAVSIDCTPAALPAAIDRESLDIVLSNLLENAFQHGGPAASVRDRRRAPSRAASIIEVSRRRARHIAGATPGACSTASSRPRARPAAPAWGLRSRASGSRPSAATSRCCRPSGAPRSGSG